MLLRDGLRTIAVFEAAKGLLVLAVGVAALELIHADVQAAAENLVQHFHLNPASRTPRIFLKLAQEATAPHLLALALGALGYAFLRFLEAYGLWHERHWAKWLAVVTGGCYLPIEVWELAKGVTWLRVTLLMLNLAIVTYLVQTMVNQRRQKNSSAPPAP